MNKKILMAVLILALLGLGVFWVKQKPTTFPVMNLGQRVSPTPQSEVEIMASNLEIPWEIAFLPDQSLLVTERPGRVLKISQEKQIIEVQGVAHVGEGGLLGLALHPQFKQNNFVYLYLTTQNNGQLTNRVERYKLVEDKLTEKEIILEGILGSSIHDGGRLAFGPDGYLYVTTGDAGQENLAQDKNSLNGKILRLKDDGSIPPDNPFLNEVYSWGHRNPQGLAWDDQGRLWATEHGPSGIQSGFDEINLIEKGKNYGWPVIKGTEKQGGMVAPVKQSGSADTWAPAGVTFWEGSLFFGGLRGEALYQYVVETGELKVHFKGEFGRIRAVVLGPDGFLYLTTSNRDGRGQAQPVDDRLIRINPDLLL